MEDLGNYDENDTERSSGRSLRCVRQSLADRFEREVCNENKTRYMEDTSQLSQSFASWCDSFHTSLPSVNPRRAFRSGAERISQTLNAVCTTFGTLSQKLRKSTRRRQPLKNIDSPKTPSTPYTRSRTMLGRTPTKLYSPFSIETPGKENITKPRSSGKRISPLKAKRNDLKRKKQNQKTNGSFKENNSACYSPEMKFSNDLAQTQIGIYEFQSAANKIIQKTARDDF